MSEKREFPILNGKLLSDFDLNGYHLIGADSIIEVVPPSVEGAGKAADAKATYEALKDKATKPELQAEVERAKAAENGLGERITELENDKRTLQAVVDAMTASVRRK